MKYLKIKYRLVRFALLVLLFVLEILKKQKKALKMKKRSENDQSTGHFQSVFFVPPDPKSEKNPVRDYL